MDFRDIPEGRRGTLQVEEKNQPPRVGTCFLITCVGLYFHIDKERCFLAHIDARGAEIAPYGVCTPDAGEHIVAQVKRRLLDFLQRDSWDITNPFFGQDLHIQGPLIRNLTFPPDTRKFETLAKFVAQAIKDFFSGCGQVLEEAPELPQPGWAEKGEKKPSGNFDKIEFLYKMAKNNEIVESYHHAFVVDSRTGQRWILGRVRQPPKSVEDEDLGNHVPKKLDELRNGNCKFGVAKDNRKELPESEFTDTSPGEKREKRRKRLKGLAEEFKDWREPVGKEVVTQARQMLVARLTEILGVDYAKALPGMLMQVES